MVALGIGDERGLRVLAVRGGRKHHPPGPQRGRLDPRVQLLCRIQIRRAVKRMTRERVTAIEVKRSWADIYHAWLQSKMEDTAWAVSNNYFTVASGKVVTQWPYSAIDYNVLLKTLGRFSETTRTRAIESAST